MMSTISQQHPAVSLTVMPCVLLLHPILLSYVHFVYQPHVGDYRNRRSDGTGICYLACSQTLYYGYKKPQTT